MGDTMVWDPFEEMERMQKRMNSMFRDALGKRSHAEIGFRTPPIDIVEKKDNVTVIAEVPGVKKENINIRCTEDTLVIEAGSEKTTEEKKENYRYKERSKSVFKRSVSLPAKVIPEEAESKFNNGVLEVTIPKKESEQTEDQGVQVNID